MSPRFLSDPQQTAVLYGKLSLISHHIYDKSLDSVEAFRWCHQSFNRVIEWWCTGIYIFILRGLKENLHVNL